MQAGQTACFPPQGAQLPGSAAKQSSRDPRVDSLPQQLAKSSQHQATQKIRPAQLVATQRAQSESSSEASSCSEDSAEYDTVPIAQTQAASRPVTRAQVSKEKGVAEQEENEERDLEGQGVDKFGGQRREAARKGADMESESWHSLQEDRAGPDASQKAVHITPQSQHFPAKQNALLRTPPSQRQPVKPASAATVATPVPIEAATGAQCEAGQGEAAKRSVPASLQADFLWSPDQAGLFR